MFWSIVTLLVFVGMAVWLTLRIRADQRKQREARRWAKQYLQNQMKMCGSTPEFERLVKKLED